MWLKGGIENRIVVLILLLNLIKGLLFASIVPPWQAPDEPKHFEYVARLYNNLRFPGTYMTQVDQQPRIIASMRQYNYWRFGYFNSPPERSYSFSSIWIEAPSELQRPPLYYAVELLAYSFVSQREAAVQLYALRIASVLMGTLIVLVAFLAARALFPGDLLLVTAIPAFIAFLPMPSFISGSVNSDNLANVIAALFIFGLTKGFASGFSQKRFIGLLALLAAGYFTKRTLLFAVPLGVVAFVIWLCGRCRPSTVSRRLVVSTVAPAVVMAIFLRFWNWQGAGRAFLDRYVFDSEASVILRGFFDEQYTPGGLGEVLLRLLTMLNRSFWAQFGWMNVRFDDPWYYPVMGLTAIASLGILIMVLRRFRGMRVFQGWQERVLLTYLASIILVLCLALGQAVLESLPGTQGRYLFPVLIPIATVFILGVRELLPGAARAVGIWMILAGLFLFDLASQIYLILPYYYG